MIFNCKWYKDKISPNILYAIRNSRTIQFVEEQKPSSEKDYVNVKFVLDKGQYGVFANEFCPGFVKNIKKADLLLLIVDEANRKCSSWIFDVKVSVGGEDVIRHLIEQWIASHQHKCALLNYLKEFQEKETIGVITRDYQEERILAIVEKLKKEIEIKTKELDVLPISSIKITKQRELLGTKLEYQMFDKFQRGYVTISGRDYPVVVYPLEGKAAPYACNIEVKCE